jgi:RES domain-containing protein
MTVEPHLEFDRLLRGMLRCASLAGPWRGVAYRAVAPRYADSGDLLSGRGSQLHGGRWNAPGTFSAIYGSLTPETAMAEVFSSFRAFNIPIYRALPRTFLALDVQLQRVLDLTKGLVRRHLGVSRRRMVEEEWRRLQNRGREALTQAIGRAAHDAGLEALRVPCAAVADGSNLVIFSAKLAAASRLALFGENGAGERA